MTHPFQLIATLGPATERVETLARVVKRAHRLRLNGSHLTPGALDAWLTRLDALPPRPVVLDLQGAKMRVGEYPSVDAVPARLTLVEATRSDDPARVPVPHPALFRVAQVGERLTLNDAKVSGRITRVDEGGITLEVERRGPLSPRKGVNRPEHPVPFEGLLPRDRALIEVARRCPRVEYAFSFVYDGAEAAALSEIVGDRRIIAKIERPESLDHLEAIDAAFDELWLCRGDLGAQAGLRRLGPIQADMAARIPSLESPAILAGQVLDHMTTATTPTRSEVVHLYDAQQAGWAGIVLSDETAVGVDPGRVMETLAELVG